MNAIGPGRCKHCNGYFVLCSDCSIILCVNCNITGVLYCDDYICDDCIWHRYSLF